MAMLSYGGDTGLPWRRRNWWRIFWLVLEGIFEIIAIIFAIFGLCAAVVVFLVGDDVMRSIRNSVPAQTFVLSIEEEAKIQAEARRFITSQGLSNATLGEPTVTHCPAEYRSRCYNYSGIDTTGQLYEAIVYVPLWKVGL
jgi:hypothetical protein